MIPCGLYRGAEIHLRLNMRLIMVVRGPVDQFTHLEISVLLPLMRRERHVLSPVVQDCEAIHFICRGNSSDANQRRRVNGVTLKPRKRDAAIYASRLSKSMRGSIHV